MIQSGVEAVDKAISLKNDYMEALVYKNLLLRLQANLEKDQTKQQAWFDSIDANFPGMNLNWDVVKAISGALLSTRTVRFSQVRLPAKSRAHTAMRFWPSWNGVSPVAEVSERDRSPSQTANRAA